MTKKRSSEILAVKMEFFSEKSSFRNFGPRKFFPSPQTRRQVSATAPPNILVRTVRPPNIFDKSTPVLSDSTQLWRYIKLQRTNSGLHKRNARQQIGQLQRSLLASPNRISEGIFSFRVTLNLHVGYLYFFIHF